MNFTLIPYTSDWETGPTIQLSHVPTPGSIVWVKAEGRRREDDQMYYVDNIMYPDARLREDDSIFLYVRPYSGYNEYAPMTETDRVTDKLSAMTEQMSTMRNALELILEDISATRAEVSDANEQIAKITTSIIAIKDQNGRLATAVDDRQSEIAEKFDNVGFLLEQIKDQI